MWNKEASLYETLPRQITGSTYKMGLVTRGILKDGQMGDICIREIEEASAFTPEGRRLYRWLVRIAHRRQVRVRSTHVTWHAADHWDVTKISRLGYS